MTASEQRGSWVGWSIAAAAAAAVFVLDLLVPLDYSVPVLYVLPILLTWLVPSRQSTALVSGVAMGLTWLGALLSPVGSPFVPVPLVNRVMTSVLLLVVAWLVIKQKQAVQEAATTQAMQRESDERVRQIFQHTGIGIAITDLDGRFVQCNPAYCALTGYSKEDLCQKTFQSLIHPDDLEHNMALIRDLRNNRVPSFSVENRYSLKSGDSIWVHKFVSLLRAGEGTPTGFIACVTDISARKQAEEAMHAVNTMLEQRVAERTAELEISNERFEWVVKATHDGMWDWDFIHETMYFSPRWKEMHGFQEQDQVESFQQWVERIHPEDRSWVLERLHAYWEKKRSEFWEEYRIRRKDGSYMWVLDRGVALWDEQGRVGRMVGAETDITWRKEAEESLRRKEHEFRTLADNVPALFSYIDRDRRYRFANKRYEELFQRSNEEIVGAMMSELLGPEGYAAVSSNLDMAFQGRAVSFEYSLSVPGSGVHWFTAQYVPDQDAQGNVAGLFVLLTEITPIKVIETALREREAQLTSLGGQLLQAQEEERRRIARELHDDFTQRLAALAIDLRMVCRGPSDSPLVGADGLQRLGDSAEQLATDLQQLAHQLHPSILEHAGLEAALREHADEFAARTGLTVEVMVRDLPRMVPLEQATCLYRVLQESLQNVRKHARATNVLIRLMQMGCGLGLCVHDDGRGFEQAPRGKGSSGLGLTSMAERVRLLKGTFRIRTKPGVGTEVHAWVPLEDGRGEA